MDGILGTQNDFFLSITEETGVIISSIEVGFEKLKVEEQVP